MTSEGPALAITELVVRYGDRQVVDGITINVHDGELVALVGESGCGKTSTALSAVGLVRPAAGSVRVLGADLPSARGRKRRAILRSIQLICQDPYGALDPRFTVEDTVTEPLIVHGVAQNASARRDLAIQALQRVGIARPERYLSRYPHELSGGQLQRVAIAAAIVLNPRVLIADEPVSMLDVSLRAGVLRRFAELRDAGLAILMITHDLVTAAHYGDQISVMYAGRIVEEGTPEAVLDSPMHPYTRGLLAAMPDPDRPRNTPRRILQGGPPDLRRLPAGCRFRPRCPIAVDDCARTDPTLQTLVAGNAASAHRVACLRAFGPDHARTSEGEPLARGGGRGKVRSQDAVVAASPRRMPACDQDPADESLRSQT